MKSLFIAGNWKSNKTVSETKAWVQAFSSLYAQKQENMTVVICAPFTALETLKDSIRKFQLPVEAGAQNISSHEAGAFTGEVNGVQLKEMVDWVIIGHSERRKYHKETDEELAEKVAKAKSVSLGVIFCVPDSETPIPSHVDVVAYEPVWAIGTGKTDTPSNANSVCLKIKEKIGGVRVIYGGSVTDENVASFVTQPSIDGVLPGGASLDPEKFVRLLEAAERSVSSQ